MKIDAWTELVPAELMDRISTVLSQILSLASDNAYFMQKMRSLGEGEENAWPAETKINSGETHCFNVQDLQHSN